MLPTRQLTRVCRPDEGVYASEVAALQLPVLTFLPTGYEPNYPYPLLVFFHGRGSSEEQIIRLAPRLSRRNYLVLSLRGPELEPRRDDGRLGYGWGEDCRNDAVVEEYALRAIEQTMRLYHVHTERVFLAGFCEGATPAYRLALSFPDKFAGVISLNGRMPSGGPLLRLPEVRQLRAFIGHGIANAIVPVGFAKQDFRLLYTAGLDVRLRTYLTTHRIHPDMLRDVDQWIIDAVTGGE